MAGESGEIRGNNSQIEGEEKVKEKNISSLIIKYKAAYIKCETDAGLAEWQCAVPQKGVIMVKDVVRNASIKLGKGWVGTCITCPHCGKYVWLHVEQEDKKKKVKKR